MYILLLTQGILTCSGKDVGKMTPGQINRVFAPPRKPITSGERWLQKRTKVWHEKKKSGGYGRGDGRVGWFFDGFCKGVK